MSQPIEFAEHCRSCKHGHVFLDDQGTLDVTQKVCKRYPPKILVIPVMQRLPTGQMVPGASFQTQFPVVGADQTCGEFKRKGLQ